MTIQSITYRSCGQFTGCSILYPPCKSSNKFSSGILGYGVPPDKKETKFR